MKYLLNRLLHLDLMKMPMTEYPLFDSAPEIKNNMSGLVRRMDIINKELGKRLLFRSKRQGHLKVV